MSNPIANTNDFYDITTKKIDGLIVTGKKLMNFYRKVLMDYMMKLL